MDKYTLTLLLVLLTSPIHAADWYVDVDASGTDAGTSWTDAWPTLASITGVSAGETIWVSDGTYVTLSFSDDGTLGNEIQVRPGSAHPTLSAGHTGLVTITNPSGNGIDIGTAGAHYVIINGNDGNGNKHIRVTGCSGFGVFPGTYSTLTYLEIDSNGDSGVRISTLADAADVYTISYNSIHDNADDQILITGTLYHRYGVVSIHHNAIYNLSDDGIQSGTAGLDIYNNTIYGHVNNGTGHPDGLQLQADYYRVYNNLMYNIHMVPIELVGSAYKWTSSGGGTNEYYVELAAGGDPSIIMGVDYAGQNCNIDGTAATAGTVGSLTTGLWSYGDGDTLGFDTIYVRLSDGTDPDTKADGYIDYQIIASSYMRIGPTLATQGGDHIYIYNNLLYHDTAQADLRNTTLVGISAGAAGGATTVITDVHIMNNTVVGMPGTGIQFLTSSGFDGSNVNDSSIVNNIVSNCGRYNAINFNAFTDTTDPGNVTYTTGSSGDIVDLIVDYNLIDAGSDGNYRIGGLAQNYTNAQYATWKSDEGVMDSEVAVDTDPLFDKNYGLTSSSPPVDVGRDLSSFFTTDISGTTTRPQGSAWDIGAYEYDGVPSGSTGATQDGPTGTTGTGTTTTH